MRITPLLAVVAVASAVSMLRSPPVAIAAGGAARGAARGGSTSPSALAVPDDAPVMFRLSACGTDLRWINGRGTEGGQYGGSCPPPAWVPARGPAGVQYSPPAGSCVRWVAPRGVEGGHYISTCGPTPRWVPAIGPYGGHYDYAAGASAVQRTTKPIATHTQATGVPSWGFDWGSAGIGAATVVGTVAIGIAAVAEVRRRRIARPPSAITP